IGTAAGSPRRGPAPAGTHRAPAAAGPPRREQRALVRRAPSLRRPGGASLSQRAPPGRRHDPAQLLVGEGVARRRIPPPSRPPVGTGVSVPQRPPGTPARRRLDTHGGAGRTLPPPGRPAGQRARAAAGPRDRPAALRRPRPRGGVPRPSRSGAREGRLLASFGHKCHGTGRRSMGPSPLASADGGAPARSD